jgi:hypothetical protein
MVVGACVKVTFDLDFLKPTLQQKIDVLQEELLKMPQADIKTIHSFEDGKYIRKMIAPAWSLIIGAEHKTPYKIRLEQGTILVNLGDKIHTLTAPMEFDAPAGARRVGYVSDEELVWVDIYDNPDGCTDIDEIEERIYVIPACGMLDKRLALAHNNGVRMLLTEN